MRLMIMFIAIMYIVITTVSIINIARPLERRGVQLPLHRLELLGREPGGFREDC